MNKKKLLIWCDTPTVPTGFGVVAKNLFEDLHLEYEVAILGIGYYGLQRYDQSKYYIYSVDPRNFLGYDRFPIVLKDFKPDIVVLFQDLCNIENAIDYIKNFNTTIPIITYFPIDSNPISN
jgi:hypothetical protein